MEGWAGWVRASLYLTDFLKSVDWTVETNSNLGTITFSWDGSDFFTLRRPDISVFLQQLTLMRDYMDQRGERAPEILSQLGYPIDYFATILGLNASRNRYTFELIAITQVITSHIAMIAKHHLACTRPDRLGPTVMPMIPTPGHSTFPSAHAAEAFAAATVLDGLVSAPELAGRYPSTESLKKLLYKQAERISVNRTVAGMHFPIDTWAGAALGEAVGQIVLAKCSSDGGKVTPRTYAATNVDFSISKFRPGPIGAKQTGYTAAENNGLTRNDTTPVVVEKSELFRWLWGKCTCEF
jgi:membrane-associated phospholipid phosphatase